MKQVYSIIYQLFILYKNRIWHSWYLACIILGRMKNKNKNNIAEIKYAGDSLDDIKRFLHTKPIIIFFCNTSSPFNHQYKGGNFFIAIESKKSVRKEPLFIGFNKGHCGLLHYSFSKKQATFIQQHFMDDFLSNPLAIYILQEIKFQNKDFSQIYHMLIFFVNYLLSKYDKIQEAKKGNYFSLSEYKLKVIDKHLEQSMDKKVSTKDLAKICDLSVFHFTRVFKQCTNCTPGQYIKMYKMRRAKELLIQSQLPVIQVSFEVGYSNPSHFTQVFKSIYGMTPSGFQRRMLFNKGSV